MPSEINTSKEHRRAPQAVCISSLSKALAPFYESFWGTKLVLSLFTSMLHFVLEDGVTMSSSEKEAYITRNWYEIQGYLRNPAYALYKDPESLQVAQVLARLNVQEVAKELVSKSRYMNGGTWDPWTIKGDGYSTLFRGQRWIHDCARHFLPEQISLSEKNKLLKNLRFLDAPQPEYQSIETRYETEKDTKIFGKDGLIGPAIMRLIANNRGDIGIQFLTDVVMRQAANVTDVLQAYHSCPGHPIRRSEYIWYISGLVQARDKFISTFRQPCFLSNGQEVSRAMREAIMDLPFVELWNALWKRAKEIYGLNMIHDLKRWILRSFARVIRPGSNRGYITNIARACSKLRLSAFPSEIDIAAIRNGAIYSSHEMLQLGSHWARHLYPEDSSILAEHVERNMYVFEPEGTQSTENEDAIPDIISRDTYDLSHLEPHGPCIDPSKYSDAVLYPPAGQNCAICAEEYTHPAVDGSQVSDGCVRLSTCGHYFHNECIGAWMNSVSANTNTCPECRTVIFEERREVRAKQVEQSEG